MPDTAVEDQNQIYTLFKALYLRAHYRNFQAKLHRRQGLFYEKEERNFWEQGIHHNESI